MRKRAQRTAGPVSKAGSPLVRTWSRILVAAVILTLTLMSVGAVISHPATAAAGPKKVELVAPNGTPLNVVNGDLGSAVQYAPGMPVHLQGTFTGGMGADLNLLTVPEAAVVSISSITVTCLNCVAYQNGTPADTQAGFFSGNVPDCSTTPPVTGTVAVIETDDSDPTVELTFPTPRIAPVGFAPSGPWCLGVYVPNGSSYFISIDGSQS
jgi:hypothetical protein